MTVQVLMPALSPTMEEGNLTQWLKKEGDEVKSGDVLAEIETDKATMEVEAADEGKLGKILVEDGTDGVKVNTPIAIILEEGDDDDDLKSAIEEAKSRNGGTKEKKEEEEDEEEGEEDEEEKKASEEKAEEETPGEEKAEEEETEAQEEDEEEEEEEAKAKAKAPPSPPSEDLSERQRYRKAPVHEPDPEPDYTGATERMTIREALRDAMAEEMRRDDKVFLMGEEVAQYQGAYKVSQGLLDEFGEKRVIDTPITEHGFAGVGIGAGFGGLRPIVEFMTFNFAMQAMDQLVNSAAKTLYMSGGQMGCPIVFRGPNGAAARVAAQHSQDYASWYMHVPGLKVVAPYSGADAKGLLKAAIRDPNPVIFLENEIMYGAKFDVPVDDDYVLPIGRARVEKKGSDVTIVAYSINVAKALEAAKELAKQDIEAEVINLRTLRPLDINAIVDSVKKTNRIVSVEEGYPTAGVGAEIAAIINEHAFDYLDAPVMRVASADVPLPYAANLENLALPQPEDIVTAAKAVCYRD